MTGRTLILLRHAKSDWDGEEADIDRPLARRGRREAPEAGRWLNAKAPTIDLALISPAVRTRETWELVAAELAVQPVLRVDERIYEASAQTLLEVVRESPAEVATLLLVGHNPGTEELIRLLTAELVPMPTSAIAMLTVDVEWSALASASLRAAGRPPLARP